MLCIYDLPVEENDARHEEKAPAVEVFDEEHRREHHEVAPVIYPAVHTALIMHDERLKRTEEKDAHIVAQIKRHSAHEEFLSMEYFEHAQKADHGVQPEPYEHDLP